RHVFYGYSGTICRVIKALAILTFTKPETPMAKMPWQELISTPRPPDPVFLNSHLIVLQFQWCLRYEHRQSIIMILECSRKNIRAFRYANDGRPHLLGPKVSVCISTRTGN